MRQNAPARLQRGRAFFVCRAPDKTRTGFEMDTRAEYLTDSVYLQTKFLYTDFFLDRLKILPATVLECMDVLPSIIYRRRFFPSRCRDTLSRFDD